MVFLLRRSVYNESQVVVVVLRQVSEFEFE